MPAVLIRVCSGLFRFVLFCFVQFLTVSIFSCFVLPLSAGNDDEALYFSLNVLRCFFLI